MKKFKITLRAELELPDDFELVLTPVDDYLALKQGGNYYHPTLQWLHRKHFLDAGTEGALTPFESAPAPYWESVDEEASTRLFEASITKEGGGTEVYNIEPV